jgi:hypothetical protein
MKSSSSPKNCILEVLETRLQRFPSSNTNLVAKLAVCRLVTSVKSLGFRGSIQTKKKKKKNRGAKFSLVGLCSNLLMKKKEKKFKSNI